MVSLSLKPGPVFDKSAIDAPAPVALLLRAAPPISPGLRLRVRDVPGGVQPVQKHPVVRLRGASFLRSNKAMAELDHGDWRPRLGKPNQVHHFFGTHLSPETN